MQSVKLWSAQLCRMLLTLQLFIRELLEAQKVFAQEIGCSQRSGSKYIEGKLNGRKTFSIRDTNF